jgi:hypothetical protein
MRNRWINARSRWQTARAACAIPWRCGARAVARLHRDEGGALSLMMVVTMLGLVMVLGMVINVGRQVDDKIKMQNAADAAAYSGGVVLARGMNSLAFTNHLLCDVFALTAFLREARDRTGESMVPDVLAAWARIGPIFGRSDFPKFAALGPAITQKAPLEQEAVRSYGEMSAAISELVLPVLEYVLQERLIPEFQRDVVQSMPVLAQQTAGTIAARHARHRFGREDRSERRERGGQIGVLWRATASPVGYPDERDPLARTLPAVDPSPGAAAGPDPVPDPTPDGLEGSDYNSVPNGQDYYQAAFAQRERLAQRYLNMWIDDRLRFFEREGKMSQYINLFRVFACGQLHKLLYDEYPATNLPHVLRMEQGAGSGHESGGGETLNYIDRNFMFMVVAYRHKLIQSVGGIYRHPIPSDPLTFAQVQVFVPLPRLWFHAGSNPDGQPPDIGGGGFGIDTPIPLDPPPTGPTEPGWYRENWPTHWDLLNQNWTAQLVPATTARLAEILQTYPAPQAVASERPFDMRLPNLQGATSRTIRRMNAH